MQNKSINKVNIFLPHNPGGVTSWGKDLSAALNNSGCNSTIKNSIKDYLLEPFSSPVTHSALPFFHPLRGKYIITLHGIYPEEPIIWSKLYPTAIKTADVVTTSCEFLRQRLNLKNALIVPNGTNKPHQIKTDFELKSKKPTLGILTGFSFYNKARGVVELAKIIKALDTPMKLYIGGSGKYLEVVKQEVKRIGIDCKFLGFCDKNKFYKKIDIFTYFSYQDVSSIALQETMALGIPCISNNAGGNPELFNGGLEELVANNSKQYCEILKELVKSKKIREKFGKRQIKNMSLRYWDNVVNLWKDIYFD